MTLIKRIKKDKKSILTICHPERSEGSASVVQKLPAALCVILLPAFFLLPSCSQTKVDKSFPQVNTIKAGEKFIVNLPENHIEGEAWKFDEDHHNKKIIETGDAIWHGNQKGIYFNFTALKPGMDTLNFSLNTYNDITKVSRFVVEVR